MAATRRCYIASIRLRRLLFKSFSSIVIRKTWFNVKKMFRDQNEQVLTPTSMNVDIYYFFPFNAR